MIIVKNLSEIKDQFNEEKINVSIGNFDGVHLGHQDFLAKIKNESVKEIFLQLPYWNLDFVKLNIVDTHI